MARQMERNAPIAGFPDVSSKPEGEERKTRRISQTDYDNMSRAQKSALLYSDADTPPVYTIDLSLPPEKRYVEVATDFQDKVEGLVGLFEEVVTAFGLPFRPISLLSKMLLHRVHSKEQTRELRGISKATKVPMYLLVAFNVLLDLFMGCTSGAAAVADPDTHHRMMHFRTLDWGMDALRDVIVQYDFVDKPHGRILARSVSYVGYVGVLTGVREKLSISLNFRPYHNDSNSYMANFRFYSHLLLVLVGIRPSISSHLRSILYPTDCDVDEQMPNLLAIVQKMPETPTTAAYLTFCDGDKVVILEKDHRTSITRQYYQFGVITNHDTPNSGDKDEATGAINTMKNSRALGMQDLLDESGDRRECIQRKWERAVKRHRDTIDPTMTLEDAGRDTAVTQRLLTDWVKAYPITNEETHYATIMDSRRGEFVWVKKLPVTDIQY